MGPLAWVAHHRLLALAMGATTLIVLIAVAVWYFLLRSPATQVDLGQALHFYRQEQKRGQANSSRNLPPTGVYRYRTTGGEQLSFAGISRSFPTSTNLIVTEAHRCATLNLGADHATHRGVGGVPTARWGAEHHLEPVLRADRRNAGFNRHLLSDGHVLRSAPSLHRRGVAHHVPLAWREDRLFRKSAQHLRPSPSVPGEYRRCTLTSPWPSPALSRARIPATSGCQRSTDSSSANRRRSTCPSRPDTSARSDTPSR